VRLQQVKNEKRNGVFDVDVSDVVLVELSEDLKQSDSEHLRDQRRKRSIDDLLSMNHPEFVRDHWLDTFRAHIAEIHARGHQLSVRQAAIPPEMVDMAFSGSMAKFDVEDEANRLSAVPPPAAVNYTQVPVNAKQILEGMITGIGGVFVPGLKDANNGTEAMATFQQCFDPRKLHETFVVKAFFKPQEELPSISDADLEAFQASLEQMDGNMTATSWTPAQLLKRFDALSMRTWKTWKYLAAILKKLSPYLLQLLKHSYRCGVLDIVLGFALSFVLPLFPPILLILIAVAAMAFELFSQIKAAVDNWYRDWFKFGKAVGAVLAFVASLIIAYKMGKSGEVKCTGQKKTGCTYEMPKNEMNNWQPPNAKKHCAGKYCNPVYQRNDIIDPNLIDNRGRTNIERMKAGAAAIGPDGKPLNLHHIYQDPDGPIAELTDTFHESNPKLLNLYLKPGEPSRIDRPAFDLWRSNYWRTRGREMEEAIKAGTYLATFGQTVANYAPVAGVAITKAWNDTARVAPAVGQFLGKAIDAITDGDSDSLVTSVKQKLAKLDIVRLLLLALKGTAVEQANRADDAMTSAMASIDPMHMCSTNAQCTDQVRLSGERFDRVDGQVANAVRKQYIIHFAPDTGYALSLSSIVNEGTALVRVASSTGDLLLQHAGVRIAEKRIVAGQLASEFADAQHRVTLQHCDGYGDYRVELVGEREPTPPTQWESPSNDSAVRDFWLANGAPPEMDKSLYSLGVQYVPYPQFAGDARATLVESSDGGQLAIAVPIGTSVARYHVFLVSREAPAVATVCDVFRAGGRLVATAVASNRSVAQFEPPVVDSRAYVVAESDNGAMTLLCPSDSPMGLEIAVRNSGVAAAVGATLGVLAVVLVVVAIVVFLVKKGKIRAPSFV
jgi:hypothetical protein